MKSIFKYSLSILALAFCTVSCDFLEPEEDNTRDESILDDAAYFCGPLNAVYNNLPSVFDTEMDLLTDNAVSRAYSGDYYRAAVGAMSPNLNPIGNWASAYANIRLLNIFLSRCVLNDDTPYKTPVPFFAFTSDAIYDTNLKYFYRLKGEAFALRAWWMLQLMYTYAGEGDNGELLGVSLVGDDILDQDIDITKYPRAPFDDCIAAILADCDSALVVGNLPDRYAGKDLAYGEAFRSHISGAAAKAIKAKALLLAASPAFNRTADISKWEKAAAAAYDVLAALGSVSATSPAMQERDAYYFSGLQDNANAIYDVIFRGKYVTGNNALETSNYPAGLYGSASINVSQNYVDAFTDSKGYPISESATYNPDFPYVGRDARLALFVAHHGSHYVVSGKYDYTIDISENGFENYTPLNNASRSGYYLLKTLRSSQVSLVANNTQNTPRANILIGMPDILLMFAEASNEAWGPTVKGPGMEISASDALARILTRDAGNSSMTTYMNDVIGSDRAMFRGYVRNQRRIELAFEGHYYYDLRRWYAADADWESKLNVKVKGTSYTTYGGYQTIDLEDRLFASPYTPIPYSEVFNAGLVQNKGWK